MTDDNEKLEDGPITLAKVLASRKKSRNLSIEPNDGPLIRSFKKFWGCSVWNGFHNGFLSLYLHKFNKKYFTDDEAADPYIKKAIEVYWLSFGSLLVLLYLANFYAIKEGCEWPCFIQIIVICLSSLISLYRIGEIVATSVRLHFFQHYKTPDPSRALILGLFGYTQAALAFGTVFLAEAFLLNDTYSNASIREGVLDSLYFSMVTIVTLGYGDSSPTEWLGKLLVITEIFVGLFLIVVVIQQVVALKSNLNNTKSQV